MVGFDSRICLRTTAIDAMYRNYRVVVLRDRISTYEYQETREAGWAAFISLRELETVCGYTATAVDWQAACGRPPC
jgi:nicotinamidase-related amidase